MTELTKKGINKDDVLKLALNLFPNHNIQINPPPQTHRLPSFREHREFSDILPNLTVNKPTTLPNLIVGRKNEKKEQKIIPNRPIKSKEEKHRNNKRLPKKPILKQTSGVFRGADSNISQVRFSKVLEIKGDLNLGLKRGIKSLNSKHRKDSIGTKKDELSSHEIEDAEDFSDLPVPLMCVKDIEGNYETAQRHDSENNFLSIITKKENEKPTIMVIKFPQFLPLLVDKKVDTKSRRTLVNCLDGNISLSGYRGNLKDISSGLIGKVIVSKSGNAVLRLGDCSFSLDTAICANFTEEIVKADVDPKARCGNLFNIGKVTHRLVATPDFTNSLRKKECIIPIKKECKMEPSGSRNSK